MSLQEKSNDSGFNPDHFQQLNQTVLDGRLSESARDGLNVVAWKILSDIFWEFTKVPVDATVGEFLHLQGKARAVIDMISILNQKVTNANTASEKLKTLSKTRVRQVSTAPGGN